VVTPKTKERKNIYEYLDCSAISCDGATVIHYFGKVGQIVWTVLQLCLFV